MANEDSTRHLPHPRALDRTQFVDLPLQVRSILETVASAIEFERERLRPILGKGEYHARGLPRLNRDMVDSMDWEDLLLQPEAVNRCSVETGSKPVEIIRLVLTHCRPENTNAFFWMHCFHTLAVDAEEKKWRVALQTAQMTKKQLDQTATEKKTAQAKKMARTKNAVHGERSDAIRAAWASGIYATRDLCAEEEWEHLGFGTYGTARRHLQGTPDPDPWPAKGM
jgi:hypothetical protein